MKTTPTPNPFTWRRLLSTSDAFELSYKQEPIASLIQTTQGFWVLSYYSCLGVPNKDQGRGSNRFTFMPPIETVEEAQANAVVYIESRLADLRLHFSPLHNY
jgi:hypothetical protein